MYYVSLGDLNVIIGKVNDFIILFLGVLLFYYLYYWIKVEF